MKFVGLIPVRLNSKRLRKKALLNIEGYPMIIHTLKRSLLSKKLDRVIVCTDSILIKSIVQKYGGECFLTSRKHKNGTERIAEVANKIKSDFYIDIQGDEPLIDPKHIDKLISFHQKNKEFDIVVPYLEIKQSISDNNIVKIISSNNKVVYFSRHNNPCYFNSKSKFLKKHLSIISFKKNTLLNFAKFKQSYLEKIESIELMRAIENNQKVGTFRLKGDSFSVDVKKNYNAAKKLMKNDKIFQKYK